MRKPGDVEVRIRVADDCTCRPKLPTIPLRRHRVTCPVAKYAAELKSALSGPRRVGVAGEDIRAGDMLEFRDGKIWRETP